MAQRNSGVLIVAGLIPALILTLVFSIILLGGSDEDTMCLPGSQQPGVTIDPESVPNTPIAGYEHEQLVNAAHIIQAGKELDLSVRDQTIGVMTAMGESSLRVLDHGDAVGPDSRGLFQQRANGAWGSYEDRMDPFTSATNFFKAMMEIEDRDTLEPTIVAHRTQRNADPYHYTRYWPAAVAVVEGLSGVEGIANGEQPVTSSHYSLGDVKPQTAVVANTVGPMFGIKTVGGYRESAHDPEGHPSGLALDFMTNDIPNGRATADQVAQYLIDHADELGVDYIIWWQQIWSADRADEGWRPMADRGSDTQNHYDHVHVNIKPDATGAAVPGCEPTTGGQVSPEGWAQPAAGPITSGYGMRQDPVTGSFTRLHAGTDFGGGGDGGPIWAAQDGVVTDVYTDSSGGWTIDVDHGGGLMTRYKHMWADGVLVSTGDRVSAGDQIGRVGSSGHSTGPHLHFEVHVDGSPVDPEEFFADIGITLG
ncbi:amidase [Intrasporangium chromatireducens Q5-1]|uniref:Amidase n=1 Tax=Intrasporangium chromatireducens Q5-1 TaxID=584657 RepID=W9GL50_9MICO|nr:M23 family metallopeptidase [Intrasporangium chromatireducens]EWT04609.1 amidase [Intrasporangium chromatireducens Q5-1]